jgi:hypothetical protein
MTATYWFPAYGHPDGASRRAWFRVESRWGYRADGHPEGESAEVCLEVTNGLVYPTVGFADAREATFEIVGSFVYPIGSNGPPWFVVERVDAPDLVLQRPRRS